MNGERPSRSDDTPGFLSRLIPNALALRWLDVDLRAPGQVTVGESTEFLFQVRNRLPVPVSLTLPTSRLWGWTVDGVDEADARGYQPPESPRTVTFKRRERRTFSDTWDGTVRRPSDGGDRWEPHVGACTLTAYLAVDGWRRRGLFASAQISVLER